MKKYIFLLCSVLMIVFAAGCSGAGNNGASQQASGSGPAASGQVSGDAKADPYIQTDDPEIMKVLDDFIGGLDLSDIEGFKKSFSVSSGDDYIAQSYGSMKDGLIMGEKTCIYHENGEYIFVFKSILKAEGSVQRINTLYLVTEDGAVKALLNVDAMQRVYDAMQKYKCPECSDGILPDGGKCQNCGGFGYILHENEISEVTKETI